MFLPVYLCQLLSNFIGLIGTVIIDHNNFIIHISKKDMLKTSIRPQLFPPTNLSNCLNFKMRKTAKFAAFLKKLRACIETRVRKKI